MTFQVTNRKEGEDFYGWKGARLGWEAEEKSNRPTSGTVDTKQQHNRVDARTVYFFS
jgi:hypothetical protein